MNTETAVLEAPVAAPAFGLSTDVPPEMISPDRIDRTLNRWLVFAGDLALPQLKRLWDDIAIGGEVMGSNYKTLFHTKYLVRKCELTPMVKAYDWVNSDALGEDKDRAQMRTDWNEVTRTFVTRYGYECFPGDEIEGLLASTHSRNDKGIREAEVLRSLTVQDSINERYQDVIFNGSEFFPDWNTFLSMTLEARRPFAKISALEKHLDSRLKAVGDLTVKSIIETYLESCEQYRTWGDEYLDGQARLVKAAPTPGGYVNTFSPTAIMLFHQLGVTHDEYLQRDHPQDTQTSVVSASEWNTMKERLGQMANLLGSLTALQVKNKVEAQESSPIENMNTATGAVKSSYPIKTKVLVKGVPGEIVAKPFGRYTVEFTDGSKDTFNYEELTPITDGVD
jgi:hypothetical protein